MKHRMILPVVLFAVSAGLVWSEFYSDLGERDRQTLAESYYLAGAQYVKVGKGDLGKEYEALAYKIYPQLDPKQIAEEKLPSAQELLAQGIAKPIAAPGMEAAGAAPRSFFLRWLGALLDQDPSQVVSFMDGSVYLSGPGEEMTRDEAQTALGELFATGKLAGLEPSAVYDLGSLSITPAPEAVQKAWGPSSLITVRAAADFSAELPFWQQAQTFYVHRRDRSWSIYAIGAAAPPAQWKPKPAAPAGPRAATVSERAVEKEITDAFSGCVAAFLKKNGDGALAFIADPVRIVRMRQTVSREELRTTFQGYFEGDFGGTAYADVVDTASLFVEKSLDFPEAAGPVYALNVKVRLDLSDKVPFWTTYQRYYFTKVDGDWKIIALF
jgi:hypothetical protein